MKEKDFKRASEILREIEELEIDRTELGRTEDIDEIRFYSNGTEHIFSGSRIEMIREFHLECVNYINTKIKGLKDEFEGL